MFWYFERFGGCDYITLAAGTSESTLSNIAPGAPVYRLDVASFCSFGEQKLYWADLPGFQMDFKLMPWTINSKADPASSKGTIVSTAGNYPFDSYHALINITARLVPSNRPLQLKMSITSLLPGFSVGTNYLSDDSDSSYIRSINIVRSTPVKIYAILVSGCIVFVSIVLFLITIDSCVFGYKRRVELLVLPVATVFAFTQLRQTLPGVPPGVDYYINLPCFFLLAFSSILSIISLAWSSPFEGDSDTRRTWFHRCESGSSSLECAAERSIQLWTVVVAQQTRMRRHLWAVCTHPPEHALIS
ncbi:hypothetical protein C8J57DRAFT_1305156 [Mycena rebaudengoi]|nr:hypothetical protein C8J57DRAFT_1305156 [Mycena rebaudengoi]